MIEIREDKNSGKEDDYKLVINGASYNEISTQTKLSLGSCCVSTACGSGRVLCVETRPLPQAVLTTTLSHLNPILSEYLVVKTHGKSSDTGLYWSIEIFSYEDFRNLAAHTFLDLPSHIEYIRLSFKWDWCELIEGISIMHPYETKSHIQQYFYSECLFRYSLPYWKKPYSFADYSDEFLRAYRESPIPHTELKQSKDFDDFSFWLKVDFVSPDAQIVQEIDQLTDNIKSICIRVEKSLSEQININSVSMSFDFPEEVKIPCEQYLLYFAQFLNDLGVPADTSLTSEAGQVLFTVTPTNKQQALDKIRIALHTYLLCAPSPISFIPESENDVAIQRLLANIDHLKSQLRLSYMMIRTQEATIQAQQTTISNQQRILSGEIIIDSIKDVTPKPKDKNKEELIEGTLSLIPIQGKGFEVNLPELFRKLKRLFKEEDEQ